MSEKERGTHTRPDPEGVLNPAKLEPCPFCNCALTKRGGMGLFWQHPQSDCFFSNQRVTSGQSTAWNRRRPHIEDILADAACRAVACLEEWGKEGDMADDVSAHIMLLEDGKPPPAPPGSAPLENKDTRMPSNPNPRSKQ